LIGRGEQATGLRERIAGKDKELDWISQELVGVHELLRKNFSKRKE
jgi:hypothetical protein